MSKNIKKQGLCYFDLMKMLNLWKRANFIQKRFLWNSKFELIGIPNNFPLEIVGFEKTKRERKNTHNQLKNGGFTHKKG